MRAVFPMLLILAGCSTFDGPIDRAGVRAEALIDKASERGAELVRVAIDEAATRASGLVTQAGAEARGTAEAASLLAQDVGGSLIVKVQAVLEGSIDKAGDRLLLALAKVEELVGKVQTAVGAVPAASAAVRTETKGLFDDVLTRIQDFVMWGVSAAGVIFALWQRSKRVRSDVISNTLIKAVDDADAENVRSAVEARLKRRKDEYKIRSEIKRRRGKS